jgi:hypothetical protein
MDAICLLAGIFDVSDIVVICPLGSINAISSDAEESPQISY